MSNKILIMQKYVLFSVDINVRLPLSFVQNFFEVKKHGENEYEKTCSKRFGIRG
jgi:hypothetical protein